MTFYYRPTVTEAFASVQYIMTEANFGWLIRSVHRWSASMMVLMMILHVFRVYLTGGFKKPRELTWVTGVVLAVLTASFGVTGYSLPWDQIGYCAVKIVTGVPEAIPIIGSPLVELLRGSASVRDFIQSSDNLEVLPIHQHSRDKNLDYLELKPSKLPRCLSHPKWTTPAEVPRCLSNSLKKVVIDGYKGYEDERETIRYMLEHGGVFEVMKISCGGLPRGNRKLKLLQQICKFPRKSPICVVEFF